MRRFIPKRRPFRFSLFGLFALVTLAAGVAAWTTYHLDWIREREAVLARDDVAAPLLCPMGLADDTWEQPPWQLRWFGAEPVQRFGLDLPRGTSDEELQRVARLFPEMSVTRLEEEPPWEP